MSITHHKIVGTVNWRALDEGRIQILGDWADQNIVTVDVPELQGVPTYNGTFGGRVPFYRGAADQFKAVWREVGERNLIDRVVFWSGSFVPRMVRGSATRPSNHTFGTAFDINHQHNGLGVTPPPAGQRGSVRELIPIFEKYGFFWGGNYNRRKDGMHFEIAQVVNGGPINETAPESVEVYLNGMQEVVPALYIDGKTYIGARALARRLSGKIIRISNNPFRIGIALRGQPTEFEARRVGDVGYVAFSDVMPLYNVPYNFNNERKRIDITAPNA